MTDLVRHLTEEEVCWSRTLGGRSGTLRGEHGWSGVGAPDEGFAECLLALVDLSPLLIEGRPGIDKIPQELDEYRKKGNDQCQAGECSPQYSDSEEGYGPTRAVFLE